MCINQSFMIFRSSTCLVYIKGNFGMSIHPPHKVDLSFLEKDVEIVLDPSIPCTNQEVEVDAIEVDDIVPSSSIVNSKDEGTEASDDDSNMEDAFDEESIHLFVDLATMDLDIKSNACRDLLANRMNITHNDVLDSISCRNLLAI